MLSKVIAIIPARGGSKGIPRKNVQLLAGKPLIVHTIEQALAAEGVTRIIVTTDDDEIAAIASSVGAEVVHRPAEISGDTATSESALAHVLNFLETTEGYQPDLVVFLQCTSPVRYPGDIDGAIQAIVEQKADSLLSVVPVVSWLWREVDGHIQSFNFDYRARPRRQERPREFNENGSIYLFKPWVLHECNNRLGGSIGFYEMGRLSDIDIETADDFVLAEWAMTQVSVEWIER